jgi:DNA recombination protein RmuC
MVSPSTLMMSLKTVHHIWQTERQNKNSEEIARQAGAMYDKLFGFLESMDSIEKNLDKAQKSYKDARNKLTEGTGNLIGRAEKLKELGVQSKKELK